MKPLDYSIALGVKRCGAMNCRPQLEMISSGTPKRTTQCVSSAQAHVIAVVSAMVRSSCKAVDDGEHVRIALTMCEGSYDVHVDSDETSVWALEGTHRCLSVLVNFGALTIDASACPITDIFL